MQVSGALPCRSINKHAEGRMFGSHDANCNINDAWWRSGAKLGDVLSG